MWIAIFLAVLLFVYMRIEVMLPKHEHLVLHKNPSLRVFLLSDLHMKFLRIKPDKVAKIIEQMKPDLFLLAGDILDNEHHLKAAKAWLSQLHLTCAAYACAGNHDNRLFAHKPNVLAKYAADLQACGIHLLIDGTVDLVLNDKSLRLSVLDEPRYGHPDITAFTKLPMTNAFRLLMTHNPEILLSLPPASADLAVSGHFHGGQIWMPFGLEFHVFRRESIGRKGVRRGFHTINDIPLYISRGLGSVLFPLRLGARPEMTTLDIGRADIQ